MSMESHSKKVYINPNFNRSHRQKLNEMPLMHVNPAFSLQHNFASTSEKPRIHVNPNFVKKATQHTSTCINLVEASGDYNSIPSRNCTESATASLTPAAPSKSRYSLIRHEQRLIKEEIPLRQKHTIAINKYKSVPVNEVRNNISRTHPSNLQSKKVIALSLKYNNKFKFTRLPWVTSNKDLNHVTQKTTVQRTFVNKKNLPLTGYKCSKSAIGKLKKNNIPCPLYRKYGKCLRKDHGQCDYLHDQKHVSLCRKFLKGLCHNKECLFSHDFTSKKMPTCHFYLKGMCSKENCPYLHVKLNENTKICMEFLKGYCEKGSECLKRHINMCPDMESTGTCKRRQCPYPHKNKPKKDSRRKIDKSALALVNAETNITQVKQAKINIPKTSQNQQTSNQQENTKDNRYYKDLIEASESNCEIKPCRIKIGILPSFIKLGDNN